MFLETAPQTTSEKLQTSACYIRRSSQQSEFLDQSSMQVPGTEGQLSQEKIQFYLNLVKLNYDIKDSSFNCWGSRGGVYWVLHLL